MADPVYGTRQGGRFQDRVALDIADLPLDWVRDLAFRSVPRDERTKKAFEMTSHARNFISLKAQPHRRLVFFQAPKHGAASPHFHWSKEW